MGYNPAANVARIVAWPSCGGALSNRSYNMKLRAFVGSSTEGREIAYALQENLEDDAVVTVWDQDIFRVTEYILQSLLKALDVTDIGIFVFSPDDDSKIRGKK